MKRAVFDASFFLSYLLPDEKTFRKEIELFINGELALVEPSIFKMEVINALRYAFASKRFSKEKLNDLMEAFQKLCNIDYVYDFDCQELLKISLKHNISIYDASYVYLSQKARLKLYSLEKKLEKIK